MQQSAAADQSNNPLANLPGGLNQKKLIIIVVAVVVLGGLGMLVRGMFSRNIAENMAENAIERATGGKVDVDYDGDDTITYKSDEGSFQAGENVSLPSDWPSDVPVMSGVKISYAGSSNPSTGAPGASVMFTTSKSASEVAAYYNSQLVDEGWTIESTANMGSSSVVSAKKGERTVGLYIIESEGMTSVTIGVQNE